MINAQSILTQNSRHSQRAQYSLLTLAKLVLIIKKDISFFFPSYHKQCPANLNHMVNHHFARFTGQTICLLHLLKLKKEQNIVF